MSKIKEIGPSLYLGERISFGGMGEVYKGEIRKEGFNKKVAIKIIKDIDNQDQIEALKKEAAKLSALSHPNICAILDVGEFEGVPYLVLEYIDGQSLKNLIDQKILGPQTDIKIINYIIYEILKALGYIHEKDIIHRDLSPHNIMVTRDGHIKLIDFGLSKDDSELSQSGTYKGKYLYSSPDVMQGSSYSKGDDVFSIGAIYFELLTGERLYTKQSLVELIEEIKSINIKKKISESNHEDLLSKYLIDKKEAIELLAGLSDVSDNLSLKEILSSKLNHDQTYFAPRKTKVVKKNKLIKLTIVICVALMFVSVGIIKSEQIKAIILPEPIQAPETDFTDHIDFVVIDNKSNEKVMYPVINITGEEVFVQVERMKFCEIGFGAIGKDLLSFFDDKYIDEANKKVELKSIFTRMENTEKYKNKLKEYCFFQKETLKLEPYMKYFKIHEMLYPLFQNHPVLKLEGRGKFKIIVKKIMGEKNIAN